MGLNHGIWRGANETFNYKTEYHIGNDLFLKYIQFINTTLLIEYKKIHKNFKNKPLYLKSLVYLRIIYNTRIFTNLFIFLFRGCILIKINKTKRTIRAPMSTKFFTSMQRPLRWIKIKISQRFLSSIVPNTTPSSRLYTVQRWVQCDQSSDQVRWNAGQLILGHKSRWNASRGEFV